MHKQTNGSKAMSKSVPSTIVAREFWRISNNKGVSLTAHQLQKLTFLAHGWAFPIIADQPLVAETAEAWPRGPVFHELYLALEKYEGDNCVRKVPQSAREWLEKKNGDILLNAREKKLVDDVFYAYGHLNGNQLSAITHEVGSPWDQTVTNEDGDIDAHCQKIENELIRDFYMEKHHKMKVEMKAKG